ATGASRCLQFQKRRQLLICTHNEALPVAAVRVHNPDRSPFPIQSRHPAQAPTGFVEVVSDDFPVFHRHGCIYRLFSTVCGAALLTSSCALTFCSPALSASICFWCCAAVACRSFFNSAMVASCSCTLRCSSTNALCSLRNSLSNIALTIS